MNKKIILGIALVLIGIGIGYLSFSPSKIHKENSVAMKDEASMPMEMNHAMVGMKDSVMEIDTSKPTPTVSVQAIKDSKDGYNIHIMTTNYKWTPENVGEGAIQGEGHAHLYVNGVKVSRVYGDWFNLSNNLFKDGENLVEVTLNANDHSEWSVAGKHISATATVVKE